LKRNQKLLAITLTSLLVVGYIIFLPVQIAGAKTTGTNTAEAKTPYGESLEITLGSESSTTGQASILNKANPKLASWLASYSDTETQNVYDVNGTYKSQEQVTLEYTLSITHSNVQSITATVKIKAIDTLDSSQYEYTLANTKSLTGTSPISDSDTITLSINQHLTDTTASTTSGTINYEIYCQVTATGIVSGETLTATINYTKFGTLEYTRSTESSNAQVTPTVSVASWIDDTLNIPTGTTIKIIAITCITAAAMVVKQRCH